ncbi:MAG: metallophosphoesterase [Proteobacteria bacterium]|nr:metallophosphoesterase [Pseudomonadota bacterium]
MEKRTSLAKYAFAIVTASILWTCGTKSDEGNDLSDSSDLKDASTASMLVQNAPTPALKVLFFGDSGKGNQEQAATAAAMTKHCAAAGCDMALLLGDNIYPVGVTSVHDKQFQTKFEEPYKDLNLIFHVILGNHDTYSGPAGINAELDYSNISSKWRMPSRYYHFKEGNAEFFALDTNTILDEAAQIQWLEESLQASTARWKVIYGHHPIYSIGDHGTHGNDQARYRTQLEPIICKYKAVYLSGHEHLMQLNALPCGGTAIVAGAAAERKPPYEKTIKKQKETLKFFTRDQLGFGYATFTEDAITIDFLDENSESLYSYRIN